MNGTVDGPAILCDQKQKVENCICTKQSGSSQIFLSQGFMTYSKIIENGKKLSFRWIIYIFIKLETQIGEV